MKAPNLTGKRFGSWIVLSPVQVTDYRRRNQTRWKCECVCKIVKIVDPRSLVHGLSLSCGCLRFVKQTIHGLARKGKHHPVYRIWEMMKSRCGKRTNGRWKDYGGRGIRVCSRWIDAANFIADMLPTWKTGLSIKRKDNNANYEKSNCRWATRKEQQNNMRSNIIVKTPDGPLSLVMALEKYGRCGYSCARNRIKRGKPSWWAVTTPPWLLFRNHA